MAEFNNELLEKAKQANSPEELLALAKENDVELTEEQAAELFDKLKSGTDLSDDELNNVAGGTYYYGERPVVTSINECDYWVCEYCGGTQRDSYNYVDACELHDCSVENYHVKVTCAFCMYSKYENGLLLCDNPNRRK